MHNFGIAKNEIPGSMLYGMPVTGHHVAIPLTPDVNGYRHQHTCCGGDCRCIHDKILPEHDEVLIAVRTETTAPAGMHKTQFHGGCPQKRANEMSLVRKLSTTHRYDTRSKLTLSTAITEHSVCGTRLNLT